MKVLIVDDEKDIASLLEDFLEMKGGHSVSLAHSGSEALSRIKKEKPDLIILDIVMPDQTGLQVAEVLRRNPETAKIPIILASVTDTLSHQQKKELGVIDFLKKPIDFTRLNQLVHQISEAKTFLAVVIDDDPEEVDLLTVGLENIGCKVISALNGETGIKLVKQYKPDFIVLDYVLPNVNGIGVINQLKADEATANIPVILISAHISLDHQDKLFVMRDSASEEPLTAEDICNKIKEKINPPPNPLP